MTKLKCGVCGVVRPEQACHIIVLTDDEKAQLGQQEGQKPPDRCIYCKPCWKTLSNRSTGPSFMKGLLQVGLRHLGVSNAELLARRYHDRLVSKIPKPSS